MPFLNGSVKFVGKAATKAVSQRKMWILPCRAAEPTRCWCLAQPGAVGAAGPDALSAPSPSASEQLLLPGAKRRKGDAKGDTGRLLGSPCAAASSSLAGGEDRNTMTELVVEND